MAKICVSSLSGFNSQPPEGGWMAKYEQRFFVQVSTHSRPKAAGGFRIGCLPPTPSFNSQPPEGGWQQFPCRHPKTQYVSTHSRPKAAGWL